MLHRAPNEPALAVVGADGDLSAFLVNACEESARGIAAIFFVFVFFFDGGFRWGPASRRLAPVTGVALEQGSVAGGTKLRCRG